MTNDTMTPVQRLATEFAAAFVTATRSDDGEQYVTLRLGSPEWMTDICRDAHDGMLPDDHRYQMIADAARSIANGDTEDGAFADRAVSNDTDTRLAWLRSHLSRQGYVDEAVDSMGYPGSITEAIGYGWFAEACEVWQYVHDGLTARLNAEGGD